MVLNLRQGNSRYHYSQGMNGLKAALRRSGQNDGNELAIYPIAQKESNILGCIRRNLPADRERWLPPSTLLLQGPTESDRCWLCCISSHKQECKCSNKQPNSLHVPCKHSYAYIFRLQLFLALNWKGRLQRSFLSPERISAKFTFDLSWSVSGSTNIVFTKPQFFPFPSFIL